MNILKQYHFPFKWFEKIRWLDKLLQLSGIQHRTVGKLQKKGETTFLRSRNKVTFRRYVINTMKRKSVSYQFYNLIFFSLLMFFPSHSLSPPPSFSLSPSSLFLSQFLDVSLFYFYFFSLSFSLSPYFSVSLYFSLSFIYMSACYFSN